jgi:hypothetical protein
MRKKVEAAKRDEFRGFAQAKSHATLHRVITVAAENRVNITISRMTKYTMLRLPNGSCLSILSICEI